MLIIVFLRRLFCFEIIIFDGLVSFVKIIGIWERLRGIKGRFLNLERLFIVGNVFFR